MSEEHLIVMMYNILTAINFIHSAGVMHRDIKPANILLDEECQVKICDFGLSRVTLDKQKNSKVLQKSKTEGDGKI